jgi:hypothetical protein
MEVTLPFLASSFKAAFGFSLSLVVSVGIDALVASTCLLWTDLRVRLLNCVVVELVWRLV